VKKLISLSLFVCLQAHSGHFTNAISEKFISIKKETITVTPVVADMLRNDGLFLTTSDNILLKDAVAETQKTWFNKEWRHAASEDDKAKGSRINKGTALLAQLYHTQINAPDSFKHLKPTLMIAHGGVLPSVIKMFLGAKIAYDREAVHKLFVVVSNEPFNHNIIKGTPASAYTTASKILNHDSLSTITEENKPQTPQAVVELVHKAFYAQMPKLEIRYIDKKQLSDVVKSLQKPEYVTVISSYPQLEAHALTFAALSKENAEWQAISGITAGPLTQFDALYDTQTPEDHYNFDRNNLARILFRLAELYQ
jgi:hypothetical protein